jgi:hypothetical protein
MLLHFPTAAQTPSAAAGFAERLAQARLAWELAEIADYVYGYNKFCECHAETPPETLVSVAGGVVQDVRHRMAKTGDVIPADRKNFALYWTIADLFALLERAASGTASVRADFDPELGVPQRIFIDYRPELIGDEVDVRVTHFNAR